MLSAFAGEIVTQSKAMARCESRTNFNLQSRSRKKLAVLRCDCTKPMYFASVRLGEAYVSFHLMPLYMCPSLNEQIAPALTPEANSHALA